MSSYICNPETYQTIIDAIFSEDGFRRQRGRHFFEVSPTLRPRPEVVHEALFSMNVEAFCQCYPGENGERTRYPEEISDFTPLPCYPEAGFPPHLTRKRLVQAYKSVGCLLYQCGEGDIPDSALYKALRNFEADLARELVQGSEEYEEALWG